jgi:hypothetical protein
MTPTTAPLVALPPSLPSSLPSTVPCPVEGPLTMTSKEIAEGPSNPRKRGKRWAILIGKRHDHVMVDIRKMLDELILTSPEFSGHLPDAYGRAQPVFHLPKDLTITLVSGYSVTMRHRIVTRWLELEEAKTVKVPTSFREALLLAAGQQESCS